MTHYDRDYFQDAADQIGGIEGLLLKCAKGKWSLDDIPIQTGPDGARAVIIMPTFSTGSILWLDGKPVDRMVGLIAAGSPPRPVLPDEKWNPYVECLAVLIDEEHRGASATFASSSWGGYFAACKLLKPYARHKSYPIVTFGTKQRGDENRNIDPVFVISGWATSAEFPGYAPVPQISGPSGATAIAPNARARAEQDVIDDPRAGMSEDSRYDDALPF